MKLLALETATDACSAALSLDGEIIERYQRTQRDHSRLILPMIDSLMAETGLELTALDALAFGCGPGSFTGVRIATGVAQGLALASDLPVVPVSTLAAVAQDYFDQEFSESMILPAEAAAFVAMDARMDEIYWGVYRSDGQGFAELVGEEAVSPASKIKYPNVNGIGIGSGWSVYRNELLAHLGDDRVLIIEHDRLPRARAVARLGVKGFESGLAVDVELAQPVYLRNKVAQKESERNTV